MKKVLILGSTGMLGSQMVEFFDEIDDFEVFFTSREKNNKFSNFLYLDAIDFDDFSIFKDFDYVINCIGTTKPHIEVNSINSIYINAIFPRKVANFCDENNIKFIHITTDCVYSGNLGSYDEDSPHDCHDLYGKSKSLGEPNNCMNIRTSIIGLEKTHFVHLVSWAISQKGKSVNGFVNHFWNGVTTKYLSYIISKIILNNLFDKRLFHFFSKDQVSKFELLNLLNNKFNLELNIKKTEFQPLIDRTLKSKYNLSQIISTHSIQEQINDL